MKKTILIAIALMLFAFSPLLAQDPANDEYIKAMTSNDTAQRVRLLKDWLNKYGSTSHQYENFANATICTTQYTGKTAADTIKYGEKALSIGGLDDNTKGQVLYIIASVYLEQSPSKARNYANQLIQTATAAKGQKAQEGRAQAWNQLIGAGYFIQAEAYKKENNPKNALDACLKSYNILKSKEIATSLAQMGKSLYDKKDYANAEKAFQVAVPALGDFGSITLYARTLHRAGKKTEALKYYKQSYNKRKTGEVAFNIGLLMAPQAQSSATVAQETIQYLLDASFLSQANSEKAMKMAEGFYFHHNPEYNRKVQEIQAKMPDLEALTEEYNSKFGEKDEEDLTTAEKSEMESLLALIEIEQKAIEKLQAEQQAELGKFNQIVEQTKQKLGVK
jgi:hypothetical protein